MTVYFLFIYHRCFETIIVWSNISRSQKLGRLFSVLNESVSKFKLVFKLYNIVRFKNTYFHALVIVFPM